MLEIIRPKKNTHKRLVELADGAVFSYGDGVYMKSDECGRNNTCQCIDLSDGEVLYFNEFLEVIPATKAKMEVYYD